MFARDTSKKTNALAEAKRSPGTTAPAQQPAQPGQATQPAQQGAATSRAALIKAAIATRNDSRRE